MPLDKPHELRREESKRRVQTEIAYLDYASKQDIYNHWLFVALWTIGLTLLLVGGHFLNDFGRYALHLWLLRR